MATTQGISTFLSQYSRGQLDRSDFTAEQLKGVVEGAIKVLAASSDPISDTRRFAEILPLEKLQEAIRQKYTDLQDAVAAAKEMIEEARYYLSKTEAQISISVRTRLYDLFDVFISILEGILSLGIGGFFTPAENEMHAQFKGQQFMQLFYQFSFLQTMLQPFLGAVEAGKIIGGTLFSIAVLSLIYPHFRPMPSFLHGGENWSKQVRHGQFHVVDGRKNIQDAMERYLIGRRKMPVLVGETGVGKTKEAKAFTQAVERGDYPKLRGMEVFYFNAADLVHSSEMYGGGNKILSKISKAMGRHRSRIILVIDEIHLLCRINEHSAVGEQLKTLLGSEGENFPMVVGLTTGKDFAKDIAGNSAFARRFQKILVKNTTQEKTQQIFNATALEEAPEVIVAEDAFPAIWQKTQKRVQPGTSLDILSLCIGRTSSHQVTAREKEVEETREKIEALCSQGAVGNGLPYGSERRQQIRHLQQNLNQLEETLLKESQERARFFELRDNLATVKREMFRAVLKVTGFSKTVFSASERRELSTFLLLSHCLVPAMEAFVKSEAQKLQIASVIDAELVNSVFQEMEASSKEADEMIDSS